MIVSETSHTWLGTFVSRLLQLQPRMHVASAVRCAVAHYDVAAHLDPRRAADLFHSSSSSDVPATPDSLYLGSVATPMPEPGASSRYREMFADA